MTITSDYINLVLLIYISNNLLLASIRTIPFVQQTKVMITYADLIKLINKINNILKYQRFVSEIK